MEPFLLGSICGGWNSWRYWTRGECVSKIIFTPEDTSGTQSPLHLSLSLTPFFWSLSLPILEPHTCNYLSFAHSLVAALMLPQSVHLFHSLFLRFYLQFHAYSHMALLTLLCHTARHGAHHARVTDAALLNVCLTFPPVPQLLVSPNHTAATQEQLQRFLQLLWTRMHFTC